MAGDSLICFFAVLTIWVLLEFVSQSADVRGALTFQKKETAIAKEGNYTPNSSNRNEELRQWNETVPSGSVPEVTPGKGCTTGNRHNATVQFYRYPGKQRQIHLSLGEALEAPSLYISWSTSWPSKERTCVHLWQPDKPESSFQITYCSNHSAKAKAQRDYIHTVHIPHLEPETNYFYSVENDGELAPPQLVHVYNKNHFKLPIAVFGDLGVENPVSLKSLKRDAAEGRYHLAIHAGDIGYTLRSRGDKFMMQIEPIAAKVPYHVIPGNHDAQGGSLKDFRTRFSMPTQGSASSHQWHSFDFGGIHVTMISTEVYYDKAAKRRGEIEQQYRWMEADLKNASLRRDKIPFVVVVGHRPLYCSDGHKECKNVPHPVRSGAFGIERLLYEYNVDMYFAGDMHTYERSFPVYEDVFEDYHDLHRYINPNKTVHVTVGNAGNKHRVKVQKLKKSWSALQINDYGYGRLTALSESELLWEHMNATTGKTTDSLITEKQV